MTLLRLVFFLFFVGNLSVADDLAGSYAQAAALGDAQEQAPATRDYYAHTLLPYYGQKYGVVLQNCFASTSHANNASFSFVAAIGKDGRVVRVYKDHETNISFCMQQTLKDDEFPRPPVSPFYLHIDMQFPENTAPADEHAPPLILGATNKYSYTFGVPAGWAFSFDQAHARGADLSFFPQSGSFTESKSVIYVNEIGDGCSRCMTLLQDKIARTLKEAKDDSPTLQVSTDADVLTIDGEKAPIRILKGGQDPRDPKGPKDREALAFLAHNETIILVVLTSRDTKNWEPDYAAFKQVVAGHKFFNCSSPNLKVPCSK